jgi:hypothetical protein
VSVSVRKRNTNQNPGARIKYLSPQSHRGHREKRKTRRKISSHRAHRVHRERLFPLPIFIDKGNVFGERPREK